jgi:hypothetical protein
MPDYDVHALGNTLAGLGLGCSTMLRQELDSSSNLVNFQSSGDARNA